MDIKNFGLILVFSLSLIGCAKTPAEFCYKGSVELKDRNFEESIAWFRKSAELGYAQSQYILGTMYVRGSAGMELDKQKGREWLEKSASQGYKNAQYELGLWYYETDRTPHNISKAFEWYEKAGLQRHVESQYQVGRMYLRGEGVEKSNISAYAWFRLSGSYLVTKDNSSQRAAVSASEKFSTREQIEADRQANILFDKIKINRISKASDCNNHFAF